jgi:hypothetical protein
VLQAKSFLVVRSVLYLSKFDLSDFLPLGGEVKQRLTFVRCVCDIDSRCARLRNAQALRIVTFLAIQ